MTPPVVRELSSDETGLAFEAMAELRTHLTGSAEFVERVEAQRAEGYRLVASFALSEEGASAVAVAGFRLGHNLAWGHYLYVDDLVTREAGRKGGHAAALMEWLYGEARAQGCDQLHLDSGTFRHDAHRFYLKNGLDITSFHFNAPNLKRPSPDTENRET